MICIHCDEVILEIEHFRQYANGPYAHEECFLRRIYGSVAHIEKRCGCFVPGSDDHDDPSLTRRQAALAAVAAYNHAQYLRSTKH